MISVAEVKGKRPKGTIQCVAKPCRCDSALTFTFQEYGKEEDEGGIKRMQAVASSTWQNIAKGTTNRRIKYLLYSTTCTTVKGTDAGCSPIFQGRKKLTNEDILPLGAM